MIRSQTVVALLVCVCLFSSVELLPATTPVVGMLTPQNDLASAGIWPLALLEAGPTGAMGPAPPKPPPTETIAIIVQSSLYASVSTQVGQYRQDLNDSGYSTILYTSLISTHQQLRGNLTQWYTSNGLVGAVIIGRLPYAQFYHPSAGSFAAETFICDVYLMDLDGNWYDTGMIGHAAGVYDVHNASAGADIYPEIFVGRIDPLCLSWDTAVNFVNSYLSRVHSYRTGGAQRQHRALSYIDDDWIPWDTLWDGQVGLAYSTRTLVSTPGTSTTGADWVNTRLSQNYQWTHICVHSTATQHWFGPGGTGGEGIVNSNPTIRNVPPSFNFYNLFACHGCQWTTADCIGSTYAFSGNYSLGVVGSSKTGGMMDCNYFYQPLGQNQTLGESLANWMSNVFNSGGQAGSQYLEWYYGMNIIGDPFLTIYYDCTALPPVISSSTHPSSSSWYADARPQFNWTVPCDVNGIVGYYYVIDQNPSSVPSASWGTYTTTNGTRPAAPLTDGTWYLHVVSKDAVGNVGTTAAHYQVNIDTTGPVGSILSPLNGATTLPSFLLQWSAVDVGSGYSHAQVWIDGVLNTTVYTPTMAANVTGLSLGAHTLNVTFFDAIGCYASAQISITVALTTTPTTTTPPIPGFPWEGLILGIIAALVGTFFMRRRRR
jgi:hypothetical protein